MHVFPAVTHTCYKVNKLYHYQTYKKVNYSIKPHSCLLVIELMQMITFKMLLCHFDG